ncbi:MAG: hypothetical protein R3Y43_06710 [Alphaproteobacteria bacterium]
MKKIIKYKMKACFFYKVCQFVRLYCCASLAMTVLFGVSFIFFLTACDGKKEDVVNAKYEVLQ